MIYSLSMPHYLLQYHHLQVTFISSSQTEGPLYSSLITHHPPPPSIGINLQDLDLPDDDLRDVTNATDAYIRKFYQIVSVIVRFS